MIYRAGGWDQDGVFHHLCVCEDIKSMNRVQGEDGRRVLAMFMQ